MPQFRRKPDTNIITAEQWWPGEKVAGVTTSVSGNATVKTIQGQDVPLTPGDFVVPEGDGIHFYPIAESVMRTRYELVTEDSTNGTNE